MTPMRMLELFNGKMGGTVTGEGEEKKGEWRLTTILSMWFQDLWNYDFRRTEMCVIPYGTQEGEIPSARNTGVGWRNIIEEMRQVATTKDWFAEKGRHQIYAGDRRWSSRTPSSASCRSCPSRAGTGAGTETATRTPPPATRTATEGPSRRRPRRRARSPTRAVAGRAAAAPESDPVGPGAPDLHPGIVDEPARGAPPQYRHRLSP